MIDAATGEQLLAAILADPDDDTVRLIYADWLDETGEEARASFIRIQCRLAEMNQRERPCLALHDVAIHREWSHYSIQDRCRITGAVVSISRPGDIAVGDEVSLASADAPAGYWFPFAILTAVDPVRDIGCRRIEAWVVPDLFPEYGALLDRQRKMMPLTKPWRAGFDGLCVWKRGFIESIYCPGDDFVSHADALTALHPIREVTLTDEPSVNYGMTYGRLALRPGLGISQDENGGQHPTPLQLLRQAWPRIKFNLPTLRYASVYPPTEQPPVVPASDDPPDYL